MSDVVTKAQKKIIALQSQIAELKRFIELHRSLDATPLREIEAPVSALASLDADVDSEETDSSYPHIHKHDRRRSTRPTEIAETVERIIREVGRPMTRGDLVHALEKRDVKIPYGDKARYVGTIVWRHKGLFENIEGRGYWLRGEPVPSVTPPDLPENPSVPDIDDEVPY